MLLGVILLWLYFPKVLIFPMDVDRHYKCINDTIGNLYFRLLNSIFEVSMLNVWDDAPLHVWFVQLWIVHSGYIMYNKMK